MSTERLFFIYAFPAIDSCARISESERLLLEKVAVDGYYPKKEDLMRYTPDAFRRMEEKIGANYWTEENVRRYWWVEHNKIIDNLEKGYENSLMAHRENCKVKFWEVENLDGKIYQLKNEKEKIKAINFLNLNLSLGNYVTTHKNHIIEKISFEDYKKYG
jgi:hypothetical protein